MPSGSASLPQRRVDLPHAVDGARKDRGRHALRVLFQIPQRGARASAAARAAPVAEATASPSALRWRAMRRDWSSSRICRSAMSTAVRSGSDSENRSAAVASSKAPAVSRLFLSIGGHCRCRRPRRAHPRRCRSRQGPRGPGPGSRAPLGHYLMMDARRTSSSIRSAGLRISRWTSTVSDHDAFRIIRGDVQPSCSSR